MPPVQPNVLAYIVAAGIVILLLSFRLRRMRRRIPLRLGRLWVAPAIFASMTALTLAQFPLLLTDWLWLGLALLIGGVFGWQRARLMTIALDPLDRTLTRQATPMAIYFLLALVVLRLGLRAGLGMEAPSLGLNPFFMNDIFVVFALGLFVAQALEMAIRVRRLLNEASRTA